MNHRVVLITGALTGIGQATALAFAKDGARVVVAGRRDEAGQNLLAELRKLDAEAEYVNADVRHENDVRNLVDKTAARFGRLDVAVHAACAECGPPGASLYAASKHAVEGLTRSAALEAAEFGVRVNVVAPGPIDTAMLTRFTGTPERKAGLVSGVPLQRMGKPEEIAELIVFLASDKASFSTGATFAADGGKTAR